MDPYNIGNSPMNLSGAGGASGIGNIGAASLGMQGVGAVFGAIGAFMSASANQSMLRGQAEIAEINARTAESNAQARLFSGQRQEQASMLGTATLKGRQRVGLASQGVALGTGSAVRTLTDTDLMGRIDANQIAANAVREAWGYRAQATNLQNEALTKRATAGAINPLLAGATSLMGSAGSVASSYYGMQKASVGEKAGVGEIGNGSGKTTGDFARMDRASPTYWG